MSDKKRQISFLEELENELGTGLTLMELAAAFDAAATRMLEAAVVERVPVRDDLWGSDDREGRERVGRVLAALQWNINPQIRRAVGKSKKNGKYAKPRRGNKPGGFTL